MSEILSIITPTYNRANIINTLYESLVQQTVKNFEWIVVDDGSSDNTWELLNEYARKTELFSITICKQENQGKHVAVNHAVELAKGDFVFIVDSDDYLSADAVENIFEWIEQVRNRKDIAGVAGLRGDKKTGAVLGGYPNQPKYKEWIEAKNTERRKWKLLGDKAEVYRTELLRLHPFPKFEGEKFLTEESVWNQFAYEGYTIRWYNKIIYWCEYLAGGLTKSVDKEFENFNGFIYATKQRIKCKGKIEGLFARGFFYEIAKRKGISIQDAAKTIETSTLMLVVGYIMRNTKKRFLQRSEIYLYDRKDEY